MLLREEGVTFQRLKTWKGSKDPRYAVKKARIEHLYAIADRDVVPDAGDPEVKPPHAALAEDLVNMSGGRAW